MSLMRERRQFIGKVK